MAVKVNYSKNGNEYYRVTATIGRDANGKLIRKEFYGKSKKEAEAKRDEYLNGIRNGLNVDFKNASLGELFHLWLFEIVKMRTKPSTFERYEGIYRNYIKNSPLYGLRLCDIKSLQIQRYYNELFTIGKSSSIIKNLNKLLKAFFNYALSEGYILKNPCSGKGIVIPKNDQIEIENEEEINVFTNEEIDRFKKALENNRLKALFLLALGTGLRQGELLALKWSDIDFDKKELKVQRSIKKVSLINNDASREIKTIIQVPKTKGSLRTVPIPSSLIPVLKEHKQKQALEKIKAGPSYNDNDFVFTTELGNNIDVRNLIRAYKRVLKKANIPYRKFHNLRHTYATKLFEAGVPLKTVSELLGHSNIAITANIYTHVMPKEKTTAAEKLNKLFS
ncbi:tyrosine-type recombinase/integrase [Caloramator australicus]|uniref:Integrase n=1 Tax=Caloramator australicus RC3 TaxID=857293 RepID=I7LFX8_9CLOT|nr:site-specific integrase [Caloramator australicus]CCJ32845.1 Integrase [Caloramator australicus RC3]